LEETINRFEKRKMHFTMEENLLDAVTPLRWRGGRGGEVLKRQFIGRMGRACLPKVNEGVEVIK